MMDRTRDRNQNGVAIGLSGNTRSAFVDYPPQDSKERERVEGVVNMVASKLNDYKKMRTSKFGENELGNGPVDFKFIGDDSESDEDINGEDEDEFLSMRDSESMEIFANTARSAETVQQQDKDPSSFSVALVMDEGESGDDDNLSRTDSISENINRDGSDNSNNGNGNDTISTAPTASTASTASSNSTPSACSATNTSATTTTTTTITATTSATTTNAATSNSSTNSNINNKSLTPLKITTSFPEQTNSATVTPFNTGSDATPSSPHYSSLTCQTPIPDIKMMENIANKIRCYTPRASSFSESTGGQSDEDEDEEVDFLSAGAALAELCLKIPPTDVMGTDKLKLLLANNLIIKKTLVYLIDHLLGRIKTYFQTTASDQAFNNGIVVNGFSFEIPTKCSLGIKAKKWRIKLSPIFDKKRFIIGDEFGK